MKIHLRLFFVLVIGLFNTPQTQAQSKADLKEYKIQEEIFNTSLKYNDLGVAKQSLYKMMILAPEKKALKDTLALLYFQMRSYPECILVSTDVLSSFPEKESILHIKAIAEQNIGMAKEALGDYEKLFALRQDVNDLYQMASLQYELKRYGECQQTINAILGHPKTDETNINIISGKYQQQVPLKAAVLNMLAVMYRDLNQLEEAKLALTKALELKPDFGLAEGNLKAIEAAEKAEQVEVLPKEEAKDSTEAEMKSTKKKRKKSKK